MLMEHYENRRVQMKINLLIMLLNANLSNGNRFVQFKSK